MRDRKRGAADGAADIYAMTRPTPLRAGMTVVIQPNVVTRDGTAGVQTGEMVLVTMTGIERMHDAPRGLAQI